MNKSLIIVGVGIAAVGAFAYYKTQNKEAGFFDTIFSSGSGLFGGAGSGEAYEVKPNNKTIVIGENYQYEQPKATDFKTGIYIDDYKNYTSTKKTAKRTYAQNDDLNFTVVKDNDKNVGGFDFLTKQSLTSSAASNLESNKNNPIVNIIRIPAVTTKKTASRIEEEKKKKGVLF